MVILGIDPGIAAMGYGVIKKERQDITYIAHGVITTTAKAEHYKRLLFIQSKLKALLKKFKPDYVAVEELFVFKNIKTALMVGQARGVILVTIAGSHIPLDEFTPLQIKQALTGYGRATKDQVQKMVMVILKLKKIPEPDDAADALGGALCLAHTIRL